MLIEHPIQVRSLIEGMSAWSSGFDGTLALSLEALSAEENLAFQVRLNRLYGACGCGTGGVASVVSLGLVGIAAVTGSLGFSTLGPVKAVGLGLLAVFVGGAVGKAIGLAHARGQLRSTLNELLARSESEEDGGIALHEVDESAPTVTGTVGAPAG